MPGDYFATRHASDAANERDGGPKVTADEVRLAKTRKVPRQRFDLFSGGSLLHPPPIVDRAVRPCSGVAEIDANAAQRVLERRLPYQPASRHGGTRLNRFVQATGATDLLASTLGVSDACNDAQRSADQ